MKPHALVLLLALLAPVAVRAEGPKPLLLQEPTVNDTHIVFSFADDLWIVPRAGGNARRLTTGPGVESDPHFSPDGKSIAFTGEYEGNVDVYVMPASGGQPRRLTYHPGADRAIGWTPDGKRVLFQSARNSYSRFTRLFTIAAEGGVTEEVPLPEANHGAYSPDGTHLAYVPFQLGTVEARKYYRGGTAPAIWLARLSDSSVQKLPRKDSNDHHPVWVGNRIYFLSDRNRTTTLFAYDTDSGKVRQVLDNTGPDFKSLSGGPDCLVLEQFGSIHLFDLKTEKAHRVDIRIDADLPTLRPHFVKVSRSLRNPALSPTGVRAVFEARGEILTVPVKKGDFRNLTNTPGVAERDPAWSPDGKWIAYFSDESGEYQLHVRDQSGMGAVKKFSLGETPAFYYSPRWSPDSKTIAFTDNFVNVRYIDLDKGTVTHVDTNTYYQRTLDPEWSPDSKWLVYSKVLKNHLNAVFLHELKTGKSHQVTDGRSDARFGVFDKSGKYLYFTASTDIGPALGGIEMSNFNYPVTRSVYIAILDKKRPSPLAPESDEEKDGASAGTDGPGDKVSADARAAAPKDRTKEKKTVPTVHVDLKDLDQRILALPIPPRDYVKLTAGKAGTLFVAEMPRAPLDIPGSGPGAGPRAILHKFDLEKRKFDKFLDGVGAAEVSFDGEKVLYRQGDKWLVTSTSMGLRPEGARAAMAVMAATAAGAEGPASLATDKLEVRVDPRAEWKQMYREVWRLERDYLYDPGHHGLDLKAAEKANAPYLENVCSRRDLNYLFVEMLGPMSLGHVYVFGGDVGERPTVKGGLLGADYEVHNGRYRFARVYRGENWSPLLRAPLTQPGVNVARGEYLLAVNGQEVRPPQSVYKFFEATAGRSVVLKVGPNADGKGAREVTVVPIESELALRNRAWMEANRRKVDQMTGGRVAYVYLPDTAMGGYTNFNRYFFAQVGKDAAILDERFNGGGKAADYIIERLQRPLSNYWTTRVGADYSTPAGAIFGPKVMLINEQAGSGGDYLPWAFKRAKLGPLVGKRTWGGLVGIGGYPPLIDGGAVTAPHFAFYTPEGQWEVEGQGVPPDYEVELDPKAWREGHDPQLEKAVALVLEALEKYTPPRPRRPAYPTPARNNGTKKESEKVRRAGAGAGSGR
jgi:tricorn protease